MSWQPTASIEQLRLRARVFSNIRQFFAERNVLEVETPLLSQHTVTDAHIESFATQYRAGKQEQTYYLQTSPEYAMKRLLAAGSGAIFQICKAFRNGEFGRQHNPEFSMLEWYRPGFEHHALMNEVDEFLRAILHTPPALKISYQSLWQQHLGINPLRCELDELKQLIVSHDIMPTHEIAALDRDTCMQLLLSDRIEPKLGHEAPVLVFDFPATQAALAKIRRDEPPVAERFEAYIKGVEVANGFHELADPYEQQQRFEKDLHYRRQHRLSTPTIDSRFIAALQHGFPQCAGVAIGLDRLLMLASESPHIKDIISFAWDRA